MNCVPERDVVDLTALARRRCPGPDGHGSGPFPGGRCYSCWKAITLAGRPLPDEARAFVGCYPSVVASPPAGGWCWPAEGNVSASVLERSRRFEAPDGFQALLRALRGAED